MVDTVLNEDIQALVANRGEQLRHTAYWVGREANVQASVVWPVEMNGHAAVKAWQADVLENGDFCCFMVEPEKQGTETVITPLEVHELVLFAGIVRKDSEPYDAQEKDFAKNFFEFVKRRVSENNSNQAAS